MPAVTVAGNIQPAVALQIEAALNAAFRVR